MERGVEGAVIFLSSRWAISSRGAGIQAAIAQIDMAAVKGQSVGAFKGEDAAGHSNEVISLGHSRCDIGIGQGQGFEMGNSNDLPIISSGV